MHGYFYSLMQGEPSLGLQKTEANLNLLLSGILLSIWVSVCPAVGVPEAPASKIPSNLNPTEASLKTTRPVPKSPSSNVSLAAAPSNVSSDSKAPATPSMACWSLYSFKLLACFQCIFFWSTIVILYRPSVYVCV